MSKERISVVCGGPSSEYEVSLNSADSILRHIDKEKYTPYIFYISQKGKALLYQAKEGVEIIEEDKLNNLLDEVKKLRDMHMNILALHGEFGEDGKFQRVLESLDIPFTGSGSKSSELCMDKYESGEIVEKEVDVKVPKTEKIKLKTILEDYKYCEDVCIKPRAKGSSVGVYLIRSQKDLEKALKALRSSFNINTDFIIQPLIESDIEASCGCLERKNGDFIKLPAIEIIPQQSSFFDYKAKYVKDASLEITPPENISNELAQKLSQLAIDLHKLLGCRVYSRSDFLIKDGEIYFLETNTLPGMTNTSLLPQEAEAAGIGFTELIDFLIENS
jgi:D-alanine-D-alanine ligase